MDIDETLKLAIYTMQEIQRLVNSKRCGYEFTEIEDHADTLAKSINAIDSWLSKGGFLPKKWER